MGGGVRQWDTLIPNLDPQSLTLDSHLPQHSLFPEKMVSSCLDAPTGVSHEDLIQVSKRASSRFPRVPPASQPLSLPSVWWGT